MNHHWTFGCRVALRRSALERVCMALVAVTAGGRAQQPLSLDEAVAISLQRNTALNISAARADAALAKAREQATALLPSVKLSAGYQRLSEVDPFQVAVPFLPQPIDIAPVVLNNYTSRLWLQQPLFTGFKLESSARAADNLARAAQYDHASNRTEVALAVTAAYWTLYQATEAKRFIDENVVRLQAMQSDKRNLLKVGLATRNDLLKVQVQLNAAQLSQIDAATDVQLAMMQLNLLIGNEPQTAVILTSSPSPPATQPEGRPYRQDEHARTTHALIERALQARPELLAAQSRIEAARATVRAAEGGWLPQIILNGGLTYARPNPRYQPTRDEFRTTWDFGVQLQFDVWNGGATNDQIAQEQAALAQAEAMYKQLKDNITLDVRRQQLAVSRAEEKVRVAALGIEQAEEQQRTMNDKYRQGMATSMELLDANVALLQARTTHSAALVEYELAQAKLRRAIGALDLP